MTTGGQGKSRIEARKYLAGLPGPAEVASLSRGRATIAGVTEPGAHVIRESVPWRDGRFTECGKPVNDGDAVITSDQLAERMAVFGAVRTEYSVCAACWNTAGAAPRWHADPVGVMAREVQCAQAAGGSREGRFRTELLAIAAIIDAHPAEYAAAVQSFAATTDLAGRRRRHR